MGKKSSESAREKFKNNLRLIYVELQTGRLVFLDAENFSDLSELLEAVKKIPYPTLVLKETNYFLVQSN